MNDDWWRGSREALREAIFVLVLWSIAFVWSVGYCYLFGYASHSQVAGDVSSLLPDLSEFDRTVGSLTMPLGLGIPDWVMWGILVPWLVCIAVTFWFCLGRKTANEEPGSDGSDEARS